MEIAQMSISEWVDKQIIVYIYIYIYNGILFGHEKQWSTVTCHNKDEPWEDYAKWKKPGTKGHILCDSI